MNSEKRYFYKKIIMIRKIIMFANNNKNMEK